MRLSSIIAVVIGTAVGLSATTSLHCPVWAQGVPPTGQTATPNAQPSAKPGVQPSIKDTAGQLKTDTGKTTDDVKAMDVNKAKQDAGQVKEDVQGLKESTKDMLTNPLGR